LKHRYEKTKKEVRYWRYAGWSLPFVALAVLALIQLIGFDSYYSIAVAAVICTFFFVSVMWWWWTLDKILQIIKAFEETGKALLQIQKEISYTKNEIEKGLSDRERRKQRKSNSL
jgi:uncharacterized membrane protein YqjE